MKISACLSETDSIKQLNAPFDQRKRSQLQLLVFLGKYIRAIHEKTIIIASSKYIDPDQPVQSAQANLGRHIPSQGIEVWSYDSRNRKSTGSDNRLPGLACVVC